MPATRRTRSTRSAQSTLSFSGVTKPVALSRCPKPKSSSKSQSQSQSHAVQHRRYDIEIETERSEKAHTQHRQQVHQEQKQVYGQGKEEHRCCALALTVSEARISEYWRARERDRMAPRVHVEHMSEEERILRFFDVCEMFGPCIGISRTSRWFRAHDLGLHPPIEVLAVLMKAERGLIKGLELDSDSFKRAYLDKLMN